MTVGSRAVSLVVVSSAVTLFALLGGACGSFGEDKPNASGEGGSLDAPPFEGGGPNGTETGPDATAIPAGCPTQVVFSDTFDAATTGSAWTPMVNGAGTFSAIPGTFAATVTTSQGHALIDHTITLAPAPSRVCIVLAVRFSSNPPDFVDGYVATMQTDVRANPGDAKNAFLGLGVDADGIFTNLQMGGGTTQVDRPAIDSSSLAFKQITYRIAAMGTGTSHVTVTPDGVERASRDLPLASIGEILLELGVSASSSGMHGAVSFAVDSVVVTAE